MKSKFNPIDYMLVAYKNYIGNKYELSLRGDNSDITILKLESFCKALVSLMVFKGFNYTLKRCNDKLDIFCDETLIITYDVKTVQNIHSETSLKFQLFCEWGLLQELNIKKKCLVAI